MFITKTIILFLAFLMHRAAGHGRMEDPPSRNSAWRHGFNTPPNYNDLELNCGGLFHQVQQGGKCGVCGDPYDAAVKNHETGGPFATGVITRTYNTGQIINVNILVFDKFRFCNFKTKKLSANHLGYFEFRLCPSRDATQDCLNKNLLQITSTGSTQYKVQGGLSNFNINVKLPDGLSCNSCVLQWRYHGGNNWGSENGQSGLGIGPQEEFINCADIAINNNGQPTAATTAKTTTTTTATKTKSTTTIYTTKPSLISSTTRLATTISITKPTSILTTTTTPFYFCDIYRGPPLTFPLPIDPYAYHGLILCRLIDPKSSITCKTCYENCSTPLKVCPQNCYCRWYPTKK